MSQILGLWLESLGPQPALADRAGLQEALSYAKSAGVTDVYLQVYREGRAWFPSEIAGQEHLSACLARGYEPLRQALETARQLGLRLHAWINVFNVGLNSAARILRDHGNGVLQSDNCGVRLDAYSEQGKPPDSRAEYFTLDAPKLWLDPAAAEVKEYYNLLLQELFTAYPEFAGLHLDFFRYPYFLPMQPSSRITCGYEFGYGEESLRFFSQVTGSEDAFVRDEKGALRPADEGISLRWDRFRRNEIEGYLPRFRRLLPQGARLSVAALAWPERAFFTSFQNWRHWLSEDLADQICLMAYTADDELFAYLVKQACAFRGRKSTLLAGSGVYLHSGAEQLAGQIVAAEKAGAQGALIFSYENLRKKEIGSSTLSDTIAQRRRRDGITRGSN